MRSSNRGFTVTETRALSFFAAQIRMRGIHPADCEDFVLALGSIPKNGGKSAEMSLPTSDLILLAKAPRLELVSTDILSALRVRARGLSNPLGHVVKFVKRGVVGEREDTIGQQGQPGCKLRVEDRSIDVHRRNPG